MEVRRQAIELLEKAESGLRALVSQAAEAGDYPAVVEIAAWASALGEMTGKRGAGGPAAAAASGKVSTALPRQDIPKPKTVGGRAKAAKLPAAADGPYPRFFRQGDQLVKVGWSRRLREEYSHKAAWRAVEPIAAAIASAGAGGRMFAPEQFIPVRDPGDGREIPMYQVYVTLAWLKHSGLVRAHGRSGYTVRAAGGDLVAAARLAWESVAERL